MINKEKGRESFRVQRATPPHDRTRPTSSSAGMVASDHCLHIYRQSIACKRLPTCEARGDCSPGAGAPGRALVRYVRKFAALSLPCSHLLPLCPVKPQVLQKEHVPPSPYFLYTSPRGMFNNCESRPDIYFSSLLAKLLVT